MQKSNSFIGRFIDLFRATFSESENLESSKNNENGGSVFEVTDRIMLDKLRGYMLGGPSRHPGHFASSLHPSTFKSKADYLSQMGLDGDPSEYQTVYSRTYLNEDRVFIGKVAKSSKNAGGGTQIFTESSGVDLWVPEYEQ